MKIMDFLEQYLNQKSISWKLRKQSPRTLQTPITCRIGVWVTNPSDLTTERSLSDFWALQRLWSPWKGITKGNYATIRLTMSSQLAQTTYNLQKCKNKTWSNFQKILLIFKDFSGHETSAHVVLMDLKKIYKGVTFLPELIESRKNGHINFTNLNWTFCNLYFVNSDMVMDLGGALDTSVVAHYNPLAITEHMSVLWCVIGEKSWHLQIYKLQNLQILTKICNL